MEAPKHVISSTGNCNTISLEISSTCTPFHSLPFHLYHHSSNSTRRPVIIQGIVHKNLQQFQDSPPVLSYL